MHGRLGGWCAAFVAEREAIRAAWRSFSAVEPQRIAAQSGKRRVGSRVTPDPMATDCVRVELVAYLVLKVGSWFRTRRDHPEPGTRLHHPVMGGGGRRENRRHEHHQDCHGGNQSFRHRPVTIPCVVSGVTTPRGNPATPALLRHRPAQCLATPGMKLQPRPQPSVRRPN